MEEKYYVCRHCGNMISVIKNSGVPIACCGESMTELVPGAEHASLEKHVPVYEIAKGLVHVHIGTVKHPMLEEHYIEWISLETNAGIQRKHLRPGDEPAACFALCGDEQVQAVFACCNIHDLWKAI